MRGPRPWEAGPGDVLPKNVCQRERVRRRRDPGDIERGDVGGVFEHSRELGRVAAQFLLGKAETGQAGNMGDVLLGNRLGHSVIVTTSPQENLRARRSSKGGTPGKNDFERASSGVWTRARGGAYPVRVTNWPMLRRAGRPAGREAAT